MEILKGDHNDNLGSCVSTTFVSKDPEVSTQEGLKQGIASQGPDDGTAK